MKAQYTKPVAKMVKFEYKQAVVASPSNCKYISQWTDADPATCNSTPAGPQLTRAVVDCYWNEEAV